jgi:hypothetical protein
MTNDDRVHAAQYALDAFQAKCRTDDCDAITDLIADLLHLARQRGEDPDAILRRAEMHFVAEEMEDA